LPLLHLLEGCEQVVQVLGLGKRHPGMKAYYAKHGIAE
jgi:hypothetical protein